MLVVTGASGQLGRRIVDHLLTLVPATRIGVSLRDPAKAADLAARGVRVRQGDYDDAASLRHAFEGATRALMVSSNAAAQGGDPLAQHRRVIAAAQQVGVAHLLYTSQIASVPTSAFPPARDHAATEAMLAASGLNWTALRHGFYAQSGLMMNARGFDAGVIAAPEDGRVSWTTHDDLAAADAACLVAPDLPQGPTAPLTGSEALDLEDLARIAAEILGRPVIRRVLTDDDMLAGARARGTPDGVAQIMMGYFQAARDGAFATVDPALERLLGRKPQTMRDFLQQALG